VTGDTASAAVLEAVPKLPTNVKTPRYQVSNNAPLWAMIAAGNGVAVAPAFTRPDEWIDTLVFRPLYHPQIWREVFIIKRRGRSLTPEVIELIKRVRERLAHLARKDVTMELL
jgi:DNA-binding transcriptional LysR family regulator